MARSSAALPPWWLFGEAAYASLADQPAQCARAISQLLDGPKAGATTLLPPSSQAPGDEPQFARLQQASQPSLREQGIALCSRERVEAEIAARLRAEAEASKLAVDAAEASALDVEQQLEEGIINPDGTPAPIKKKRPGPGRPPNSEKEQGASGEGGGEGKAKAKKAKSEEESAEAKAAAKKAAKEAKEAEKQAAKEAALAAKKAAKKAAAAGSDLFEPNGVVEVSLRLGEAFANWYEATLLEQGKGGKWKLALRRLADGGAYEPLHLQGRPAHESAQAAQLRPLPPPEPEWSPSVGEFCELFFEDGWWKVRVQAMEGAGGANGWTVIYAPAQAVHTVPRERLRPIYTWDGEQLKFAPIKSSRGNR